MKRLLLAILLASGLRAASPVDSGLIFEVESSGSSNSNGGCFKSGASGTDFTINAGKYNFTDLASTTGTTNPTDAGIAQHQDPKFFGIF